MGELLPGFRFYPTDEELVIFYLTNKLEGRREDEFRRVIPVVDIYDYDPWNLPHYSGELCHRDREQWFFFCPIQEREARGGRPNRMTSTGYWKATGSPGFVYGNNRVIGVKKTMVFYEGKAPTGNKTQWKMTEYKAIDGEATSSNNPTPMLRHEYSVCRVYVNSGSLRSFDRRPLEPTAVDQETAGQAEGNVASSSNQNSNDIADNANPAEIPLTMNNVCSFLNAGENNWEMDALWERDWDQISWPEENEDVDLQ